MHIDLKIRREVCGQYVCFKHAVEAAMNGENVMEEIEVHSDSDFRSWFCQECLNANLDS